MWIKSKYDEDAKWKRIKYQDWNQYHPDVKAAYLVKDEPPATPAQRAAMNKGRIIRHTRATQAQATIALNSLDALLFDLPLNGTKDKLNEADTCLRLSRDFAVQAEKHIYESGVIKQTPPTSLS